MERGTSATTMQRLIQQLPQTPEYQALREKGNRFWEYIEERAGAECIEKYWDWRMEQFIREGLIEPVTPVERDWPSYRRVFRKGAS